LPRVLSDFFGGKVVSGQLRAIRVRHGDRRANAQVQWIGKGNAGAIAALMQPLREHFPNCFAFLWRIHKSVLSSSSSIWFPRLASAGFEDEDEDEDDKAVSLPKLPKRPFPRHNTNPE